MWPSGRARRSGRRDRWFESSHPDILVQYFVFSLIEIYFFRYRINLPAGKRHDVFNFKIYE